MHHGSRAFHIKMKLLSEAVAAGKSAYLVNSVWQDNPPDYDDVLRQLAGISVRENLSRDDLLDRHGIAARVLPDVSFFAALPRFVWRRNYRSKPAITDFYLPDRSVLPDRSTFDRLDHLFPEARPLPFKRMSWARAVASIKTTGYLITGRQHAVYAACKARTPFVASEGNTHKIRGLILTAGADIPVGTCPADLVGKASELLRRQDQFTRLFDWLAGQDYWAAIPAPEEIWQLK